MAFCANLSIMTFVRRTKMGAQEFVPGRMDILREMRRLYGGDPLAFRKLAWLSEE